MSDQMTRRVFGTGLTSPQHVQRKTGARAMFEEDEEREDKEDDGGWEGG